jgi:hypothetical protein
VASIFVLTFGPNLFWNKQSAVTLVVVAINLLVGFGLIVAYKNNINDYDDLQKKITLEVMAITLGVVFVVGIPYELISKYQIIPFQASLAHLYFFMALTLVASVCLGMRRYR